MSITSFTTRNFDMSLKGTPADVGPGSYVQESKRKTRHYLNSRPVPFGSTTRRELFPSDGYENVGPGSYELNLQVRGTKATNDSFTLSSKREYFIDRAQTPGPAQYSNQSKWITQRPESPSPYLHPKRYDQREKTIIIGTEITPGPSDYDTEPEWSKNGGRFGDSRSPQREPIRHNGIPGPGEYESEVKKKKKDQLSPQFRNVPNHGSCFDIPENRNETMVSHTAWCDVRPNSRAFNSGAKRTLNLVQQEETPGADVYAQKTKTVRRGQEVRPFGASRIEEESFTPGPGYYNDTEERRVLIGNGSRCGRRDIFEASAVPGPGTYESGVMDGVAQKGKLRMNSPVFKPGGPRYGLVNPEPNPGPAYNTRPKRPKTGFELPKGARFTDKTYVGGVVMNDSPSPAEYTSLIDERQVGGYIPRENRTKKKGKTLGPGPAKYSHVKNELRKMSYNVNFNPSLAKPKPYHEVV